MKNRPRPECHGECRWLTRPWRRAVILGLALNVWALGGGSSRAAAKADARREETLARITSLSLPERDRLRQNLKLFRELPDAERDRLRKLHAQLEADSRSGGNLKLVLNNYYDWLKTLTPGQRSDLQREADAATRRKNVAELLQKQQEAADPSNPRRRRMGLSAADLEPVMQVLERQLLSEGYLTEGALTDKTGLARYSVVLRSAFGSDRRESFPPAWMRPELLDELIAAVGDEEQRRLLARDRDVRRRAGRLFVAIFSGVMLEFRSQGEGIDRSKLEEFFVGLKGERQDEIMRLPPDTQNMRLRRMYMEAHPEEFPQPPMVPPWLGQVMRAGGRGLGGGERPGPGGPMGRGPEFGPGPEGDPPAGANGEDRNPRRPGPGGERGPRGRGRDRNRKPDA